SGASDLPRCANTVPCARIVPPSIDSNPAMQRNAVVLPHPLGPSRQPIAPRSSSNDRPFTALRAPNVRTTSISSSHMFASTREHCRGNQTDENDRERRERCALPLAFRRHLEYAHGQCIPPKRTRDERD